MSTISGTRKRIAVVAAATTISMLASAGAASAAQVGQLCRSTANWPMLSRTSGSNIYNVSVNEWLRIDGFSGDNYYLAHTDGHSTGRYPRAFVDRNNCH